jgi:hypothetical protein
VDCASLESISSVLLVVLKELSMDSKCSIGCCPRCNEQDATIQFLSKRVEDLEERLIHIDSFLSKMMERRCHNYCYQDEYGNHEAAIDDIHNGRIVSVLQSRKLVGNGRETNKIPKGNVKPRDTSATAPQTHTRKFKSLTSEDGFNEIVEQNNIQEKNNYAELHSGKIMEAPNVSCHEQKPKGSENHKNGLSKKVKFVNSTATQVRYAHLESDNGLAPGFHAETRIIYDCYHTAPSPEIEHGFVTPYRCKTL